MEKPPFPDWEERLAALEPRLAAWEAALAKELARATKARRGLFRRPGPAELEAAELEARQAVDDAPAREAAELTVALAAQFLVSLPGERARIRARTGDHGAYFRFLGSYLDSLPGWVRDERTLQLALAVFAIHDLRGEVERVLRLLAELWIAAEEHGLEPAAAFGALARLANPATGGGAPGTREHLEGFERSKVFREHVLPRLRSRRKSRAS